MKLIEYGLLVCLMALAVATAGPSVVSGVTKTFQKLNDTMQVASQPCRTTQGTACYAPGK